MDSKQPMFSIIMACYNHGQYVGAAIESILNQTCQDFELIVADDGSTDNSWEIIQKYSDRIKSFRLEENDFKKCTEMMMKLTTGKYLAQMSSDDYWYPEKLELQAKAIDENPNCYAYFTWASFTDENLKVTVPNQFSYENRTRYEWFRTTFSKGTVLAIGTMVTVNDKEKWLKYSQSVLRYRQLPDQMVFLQMFLNGDDVYVVPEVEMKIRRHDKCIGTITQDTMIRTNNECISIWEEMWERMPDDFFVKAFYNDLYDKHVADKTEILCERMMVFLKLAQSMPMHQMTAINYFTRHYCDAGVAAVLLNKYHYTREDFFKLSGEWGTGLLLWLIKAKEKINDAAKLHLNTVNEELDAAAKLYECNRKLLNVAKLNVSGGNFYQFAVDLKNYLELTAEVLKVCTVIKLDFDQEAWSELMKEIENFELTHILELSGVISYLEVEAQRLLKIIQVMQLTLRG